MTEGVYVLPDALAARTRRPIKAVVLAGGKGTRLAPYTSVLPKPLMPIGDRSILELVIGQLRDCGITDVTLSVGYLAHLIEAVLDNRPDDGVDLTYVHEEEALGTAAPLRLVDGLDSFHKQALEILRSDKTKKAFNLGLESKELRDKYTTAPFGTGLLAARRLVEAGVRFVSQPRRGLHREAEDEFDGQHGHLRARAPGAVVHPAGGLLRLP